ncbi:MAG TPA: L,D-transpeptidase [Burkholderiaceae bacterium]|nr:L,D-transpeptidase [Burkholderiaceae bacterium]
MGVKAWARAAAAGSIAMSLGVTAHADQAQGPSNEAAWVVEQVLATADHRGRPFAVVDKKDARLYLFSAQGRLLGTTAVLLGQAGGDQSLPGVGAKHPSQLLLHERTTPAGRFASEPGVNDKGEDIVWFDYDAALAIHRLRPGSSEARRARALASPTATDNRQSLGCVVVPVDFYDSLVKPTLGRQRGVVYVLPEGRSLAAVFESLSSH